MSIAKLTLIGMYKYGMLTNVDIFSGLTTPTGIDKTKLKNVILMNGAEFEVLYSDLNYMQFLISIWSDKMQHTMSRWAKALSIDYNPLENYDRMEDWVDSGERKDRMSRSDSGMNWSAGYKDYGSTDTTDVAAFDSSTYSPKEMVTNTGGGIDEAGNQTMTSGTSENTGTDNAVHTGRTHGNIGVTTSQQMLQAELEVAKFNVYNELADLFLQEFCIYTY